MKILLVDNFDSFTNNIFQYIYEVCGSVPDVIPNNTLVDELNLQKYDAVILSPGPGRPENESDFGICRHVLAQEVIPVLGVCLGHQGINHFYGGKVEHAPKPVHGYRSKVNHSGKDIFFGIPQRFEAVRYHSLLCTSVPSCLEAVAWTDDGLIMALAHRELPVYGVQFHPESIDSEYGREILANFIRTAISWKERISTNDSLQGVIRKVGGPSSVKCVTLPLSSYQDPENIFIDLFSKNKESFWLDSELSNRSNSRYSVMGDCSQQSALSFSYKVKSRKLIIKGPSGIEQINGDFFDLMDDIFKLIPIVTETEVPFPFHAGVVGYLGYELRELNGGDNRHQSELPDALFYLPQNYIVFDHQEDVAWVCNLWGDSLPLDANKTYQKRADTDTASQRFKPGPIPENLLTLDDASPDYINKIAECLKEIKNGESYEICLTNRAQVNFYGDSLEAYTRMRKISPVPYGAFFKNENFSILSSSPETFLKIERDRRIKSKPIKGTRPRSIDPGQDKNLKMDLKKSDKDRAENLMIVDLVRHDLNGICIPGSVKVPLAFDIESYSSVHQLVSTVEGKLLSTVSQLQAIKSCFPGGSMTGAPKIRTMKIIDRLESSAREIYAGAIGWIGLDGYTDLSIVIRTAVVQKNIAKFGIGGAIVADSNPDEEMQETLVKASVPFHSLVHSEKPA